MLDRKVAHRTLPPDSTTIDERHYPMSTRIGLFTHRQRQKKGQPSAEATYVEVATAAELAAKVLALGAKRAGLMHRDRAGTTQLEGTMFAPSELSEEHFAWLTAKPTQFEVRGLFYD